MNKCPFCGSKLQGTNLPPTRGRYRAIYHAVASAGVGGIRKEDLHKSLPGSRTDTSLRVAIHYTNNVIERLGQRIICRRDMDNKGRYFLVSTGESNA